MRGHTDVLREWEKARVWHSLERLGKAGDALAARLSECEALRPWTQYAHLSSCAKATYTDSIFVTCSCGLDAALAAAQTEGKP